MGSLPCANTNIILCNNIPSIIASVRDRAVRAIVRTLQLDQSSLSRLPNLSSDTRLRFDRDVAKKNSFIVYSTDNEENVVGFMLGSPHTTKVNHIYISFLVSLSPGVGSFLVKFLQNYPQFKDAVFYGYIQKDETTVRNFFTKLGCIITEESDSFPDDYLENAKKKSCIWYPHEDRAVRQDIPYYCPVTSRKPVRAAIGNIIDDYRLWDKGELVVTIGNISNSDIRIEALNLVKEAVAMWNECIENIKFSLKESKRTIPGDVHISLKKDECNWSYIGKPNSDEEFTMNLNPLYFSLRNTLHQFGHALGLLHEHQTPRRGIAWNKQKLYKDLSGYPNCWSIEKVNSNIINSNTLYSRMNEKEEEQCDYFSIMHYKLNPGWVDIHETMANFQMYFYNNWERMYLSLFEDTNTEDTISLITSNDAKILNDMYKFLPSASKSQTEIISSPQTTITVSNCKSVTGKGAFFVAKSIIRDQIVVGQDHIVLQPTLMYHITIAVEKETEITKSLGK